MTQFKWVLVCFLCIWFLTGCGNGPQEHSTVFTNVSVVPMDTERVVPDQTVVVSGDIITSVGPSSEVAIPRGATVIDGTGRFLIPGLADMHVHLETEAFAQAFGIELEEGIPFESVLSPYLQHGVTTIRVMSGASDLLRVRDSVRSGTLLGPKILVASPMIDGDPPILPPPLAQVVTSPDEATDLVREYGNSGYDLIKVRSGLSRIVYDAVIAEAHAQGMFVDGHIPRGEAMSADHALSSQDGVAHLEEFVYATGDLDRESADRFAEAVASQDVYVTTTLGLYPNILAQLDDLDSLLGQPEVGGLYPLVIDVFWRPPGNPYVSSAELDREWLQRALQFQRDLARELNDAGVVLLAGTDALNPAIIPGSSLWDELAELVESGLSPFEALRTATVNPYIYLYGRSGGSMIAPGERADLVLLEENPLLSIEHLSTIYGAMVGGRWTVREGLP